jgi:hypothetical protein
MFCGTYNVEFLLLWWENMSGKRLFYLLFVVWYTGYGDSVTGVVFHYYGDHTVHHQIQNLLDSDFGLWEFWLLQYLSM